MQKKLLIKNDFFIFALQNQKNMIIIPVKEGESIDRPLKRFKRKFDKTRGLKNLRARRYFTKKSEKRRNVFLEKSEIYVFF